MPPSAISKRPLRSARASVKAPRTWPNISLSNRVEEMPPRLTLTNGPSWRRLLRWIASATSSLPVPLSPVISTEASVGATRPISSRILRNRGSAPIRARKSQRRSSSSRLAGAPLPSAAAAASDRAVSTACSSWAFVHGLVTKSAAPAFIPSTASPIDPQAVIRMTGIRGRSRRIAASSSSPSSPVVAREKFMSWSTRSNSCSRSSARASSCDRAARVGWPCRLRRRLSEATTDGSSSTIRIIQYLIRNAAPRPAAPGPPGCWDRGCRGWRSDTW